MITAIVVMLEERFLVNYSVPIAKLELKRSNNNQQGLAWKYVCRYAHTQRSKTLSEDRFSKM